MNSSNSITQSIYDTEPYLQELTSRILAVQEQSILLDKTIFYPTGGGQPGDTGEIDLGTGEPIGVIGTYRDKERSEQIWLQLDAPLDPKHIGSETSTTIDWDRRYRHMQLHTCLHLLCSLVDAPVTGCNIGEHKARLDFDLPEPSVTKAGITEAINELIKGNFDVRFYAVTPDELEAMHGIVRTAGVSPPVFNGLIRMIEVVGVDNQPCGGTHVNNTEEILPVVCSKIKKVSASNRRIELTWAG